jgi:hypothetical protein
MAYIDGRLENFKKKFWVFCIAGDKGVKGTRNNQTAAKNL